MDSTLIIAGLVVLVVSVVLIERAYHKATLQAGDIKLLGQQQKLESSIADLKKQAEQTPTEKTPEEITDYWNKK